MPKIVIGIPTFKRPASLNRLLKSLSELHEIDRVDIAVIDNDPDGSAKDVCDNYSSLLNVHYMSELRPGVSHVRNRIIDFSLDYDGLAFLDDDETPSPGWLEALLNVFDMCPNSIQAGPVNYVCEDGPPLYDRFYDLVRRPSHPHLSIIESTGTGNSFIPVNLLRNYPSLRFSPKMGIVGGEDTVFFRAATALGIDIVWNEGASVNELVPSNRTTLSAVKLRLRRAGFAGAFSGRRRSRPSMFVNGSIRWIVGLLELLSTSLIRCGSSTRSLARRQSGIGWVAAAFHRFQDSENVG
nr:glycosyltransferase family A protein [Dietzia maris]